MDYGDPEVRPLLDLGGPQAVAAGTGRAATRPLEAAVDRAGFYDAQGAITADDYRP